MSLKQKQIDGDSTWLDRIEDEPLRAAWQHQGYFNVAVTARALPVGGDATHQHFSVTVHVDEGLQYRLGSIRFFAVSDSDFDAYESSTGVTLRKWKRSLNWEDPDFGDPAHLPIFPPEELRKLIPLQDGDILDAERVVEGLKAIQELYGAHGYIDATPEPRPVVDDEHQIVSLRIALDELQQYRIRQIEVFGLDAKSEKALTWKMKPGAIFDERLTEAFFKDNQSILPTGASPSENFELRRNTKAGTVDITLRFWHCPPG